MPIVAFGRDVQGARTHGFCLDNYRGACEAARQRFGSFDELNAWLAERWVGMAVH